jgi:precorrin-4 methylase
MSEFQIFLFELNLLNANDEFTHRGVINILSRMTGKTLYLAKSDLQKPLQIKVALALLLSGAKLPEIRDRLISGGYVNSRNAAYRVIVKAINERRPVYDHSAKK